MSTNTSLTKPEVMNDSKTRVETLGDVLDKVNLADKPVSDTESDSEDDVSVKAKSPKTPTPAKPVKGKNKLAALKKNMGADESKVTTPTQQPYKNVSMPTNTGRAHHMIGGRNIGSSANEPKWTPEQLSDIEAKCSTILETTVATDTRRSVPDPERRFVKFSEKGTVVATPLSLLPNLTTDMYKIGVGKSRVDEKLGKPKAYSDVICVAKDNRWVLNQWTSMNVIMESVQENILNRPPKMIGGRPERKIGENFARFGLPKSSFGPIIETMNTVVPGCANNLASTNGYYWTNAAWGVNANPATFTYVNENGTTTSIPSLPTAMRMIMGHSSMGIGTFAISISCDAKTVNGVRTATQEGLGFSIKCHNMVHLDLVDYHGPPQAASVGVEISDDIMSLAKPLTKPAISQTLLTQSNDAFVGMNPFSAMTSNQNVAAGAQSATSPDNYL